MLSIVLCHIIKQFKMGEYLLEIWNKIKKNKITYILMCIVVVFGIPVVINILLYCPIPTSSTTDADWLSFWGSFLGSIIGGVTGLVGVILTIKKMENDRIKDESTRFPCLIPIEQVIVIFQIIGIDQNIYTSYDENNNPQVVRDLIAKREGFPCKDASINIVNVGEEHAISVRSIWESKDGNISKNDRKVQIIRGASTNDLGTTDLPINMRYEIERIIRKKYEDILEDRLKESFEIGKLTLKHKRRNGKEFSQEYNVIIKFFTRRIYNEGEENKIFFINLSFNEVANY